MSENKKSLFQTLATASALAVPASFAVSFVLSTVNRAVPESSQGTAALLGSILGGVIMLGGVIAGIVALFGIPRHGREGILWKALFGILFPILLSLLALPALFAAKQIATDFQRQSSIRSQLAFVEKKLNEQCPVMVDEVTRLESVQAGGKDSLIFNYTLLTMQKSDFPDGEFEGRMRGIIVDAYNSAPDMKLYRDGYVTVINRYRDKSGTLVAEISVGPKDLRGR